MSEDSELLAQIGRLAGQINRHKNQTNSTPPGQAYPYSRPYRGSSYSRPYRGRGGFASHKNRTLVLNKSGKSSDGVASDSSAESQTAWITKRDRHMQLINSSVFDKESQSRARAMEESRQLKEKRREEKQRLKFGRFLQHHASSVHDGQQPEFTINVQGIKFRVAAGGSKLIRVNEDSTLALPSPKKATVGGVTFLRSKSGNLWRSGFVVSRRYGTLKENNPLTASRDKMKKIAEPCRYFSTTGTCAKGPKCPYIHDPNKVAICKEYLQKGSCPAGDACDLSHEATPHRVPACVHFLRGNCSNDSCRYAHVRVSPSAPVCRSFAIYGYCDRGAQCPDKHVHECPDYANNGSCSKKKCSLPHIDRAGQIRKAAAHQAALENGEDEDSDVTSDMDEYDSDDVDSDGFEEELLQAGNSDDPRIANQEDFVHF